MPSPFPGMNPYLEQEEVWPDFHQRCITAMAEVLGAQLRPRYFVKIEERLYVHEPESEGRQFLGRSDVAVTPTRARSAKAGVPESVEAPATVRVLMQDVERSSYLEVRDRASRQLITVVELLSPSNKRSGKDREQYEAKRTQILWSGTNLVEIDLLRGGPRMPMAEAPPCDYCVLACRPDEWPRAGFWPIRLRDPLPVIAVPLRAGEPSAKLDLQELIHRLYDRAGYELYIYGGRPDPPLSRADAAWARQRLPRSSGERKREGRERS